VLSEPHAAPPAALQTRFLADGVRVRLAHSLAQVRTLLAEGAQALVLAAQLADGEGVALTRALRGEAARAGLPIFLLAPPEDRALLEAAFDAGVSDVLTHPVNPDVLAAKLRRALQPPPARTTP
jgi:eukaryotic-like serine/threonine-protein kinase